MTVYDVSGRLVRDLGTVRQLESERFNLAWDGRDAHGVRLPAGVYFLAVRLDYAADVVKITLVR
jgi:flagellar hook assembly protein FlgD